MQISYALSFGGTVYVAKYHFQSNLYLLVT